MLDLTSAKAGRLLSVTKTDIEQRKAIAGLADDNIPRITSLKSMIEQRADHYGEVFFQSCRQDRRRPEVFARRGVLDQTKQRKRDRSRRKARRQRGEGRGRPRAEHRAGDRGGASRHDRIFLHGR